MANSDKVLGQFMQEIGEERVDTSHKLKIGIIGTGWIAESHIQSYKNMPDVEIVAAADLIPGKAEAFMKTLRRGGRSLLSQPQGDDRQRRDWTALASAPTTPPMPSPPSTPWSTASTCCWRSPSTVTIDEAVEIMRAEKKSGKILSIGFQPRGDENMKMIKKYRRQSGVLGKIYYIQTGGGRRRGIPNSTFIEKSTGGIGALGDIGCYSLDMVLNAIGYPKPLTVSGYTSDFFGTNPKYATPDAVPHRR